jgi:hypothetical protein
MNANQPVNYSEYRERYNSTCQLWRSEPVKDRKVNNPLCIVVLIVITLAFLAIGGYYIATKADYEQQYIIPDSQFDLNRQKAPIIVCTLLSIAISLVYIFLIKLMPRGMILTMIFVSLGLIGVLCIIGVIIQNYALAISMGVILLVYACILGCFRQRIKTGIVLVKVATTFISEKPIVFLTPIIKVVLTLFFAVFWAYTVSLMV